MRLFEIEEPTKHYSEIRSSTKKIIDQYGDKIKEFSAKGKEIWRGQRARADIYIADGAMMERKSANTSNYYTLMMQLLPSWKGWPPRNKSFICSTRKFSASAYGTIYKVIPLENQNIAIAPTDDFWNFADSNFARNDIIVQDLDFFNREFKGVVYLVKKAGIDLGEIPTQSASDMQVFLKELNNAIQSLDEAPESSLYVAEQMFYSFKEHGVFEMLNRYFDPKTAPCQLVKADDFKNDGGNQEVWLSGKVLLIESQFYEVVLKEHLK